jgi:hypothetical protein
VVFEIEDVPGGFVLVTKRGGRALREIEFVQPAEMPGEDDDYPFKPFCNKD